MFLPISLHDSQLILPYSGTNTLCDFFITFTVFRYMWKSSFRRRRSVVQDLARVCVYAGAFTWWVHFPACYTQVTRPIFLQHAGNHHWYSGALRVTSCFTRVADAVNKGSHSRRQLLGRRSKFCVFPEQVPFLRRRWYNANYLHRLCDFSVGCVSPHVLSWRTRPIFGRLHRLNARKIIRDRERDANVIELTTIPVALEPGSSNSHQA